VFKSRNPRDLSQMNARATRRHEHLPPQARKELKEVGWTKGVELAKLARRDRQAFACATWLHKAREMPKEQFKQEVEDTGYICTFGFDGNFQWVQAF
jgi:hypothetical protein